MTPEQKKEFKQLIIEQIEEVEEEIRELASEYCWDYSACDLRGRNCSDT